MNYLYVYYCKQVQDFDSSTSMVKVGSLDYGQFYEVHKSELKPLVKDMAAESSLPYRVSDQFQ